ncbi:MAG: VWA domain-containing protein [Planctomycetes bacterium]|nr:VWA domain-containing protein [Planctomycetota bacterium]
MRPCFHRSSPCGFGFLAMRSIVCAVLLASFGPANNSLGFGDHIVVVLDDSGSMREVMRSVRITKIDAAKRALEQVIQQVDEDTRLGILLLNGMPATDHWLVPLGPVSKTDAAEKISHIGPNGGTPLGSAMRTATEQLLAARAKYIYGTYRLVVVTDGEASDRLLLEDYLPDILSRGIIVDAIGVDMQANHSLATHVHSYRRADDSEALKNAMIAIMAEGGTDQDQSTSDADFELLNALNDVNVQEIIGAISSPNNKGILGARRMNGETTDGKPFPPTNAQPPQPNSPFHAPGYSPPASHPVTRSTLSAFLGTICCFMILFLVALFAVIVLLLKSTKK